MKTPWSEFDAQLWDPLVSPQWIYVLRRGDRVFQSHIQLGWSNGQQPKRLLSRYKESVRLGEAMHACGAARICQMDLAVDPDSRWRLAHDLFDFLDEKIDTGVANFVEKWPIRLPATHPTNVGGPTGDVELPDEWQQLLDEDRDYQELMHAHGY